LGSQLTLSGGGASNYAWSTNGIADGVPFIPGSSLIYTVIGTDINGCSNTATVSVTVNPLPTWITASTSQTMVCTGNSVTLTGGGASTYTWLSALGTTVTNGVPFTPLSTDTYTVTGTDANGCSNTSTQVITVNVNALPIITVNNGSVCAGHSFTITPSGATSYTYSSGSAVVTPTANATYSVTGANAFGCVSSVDAVSSVTVNALPNNATTLNGVVITATQTGSSYQWINCAGNAVIGGATAQSYTAIADGNYKVVVSNGNCSDTSACVNINTTGIAKISANNNQVTVYPNPSTGNFVVTTTESVDKVSVTDVLGNELLSVNSNGTTININLSAQPSGVYFIKVSSNGIQTTKRIIIHN
jgi:hypothetical protein